MTTWAQYASEFKKCFLQYAKSQTQATRYESAKEVEVWTLHLPEPFWPVCVSGIEQAREVAARYGCKVIL